MGLVTGKFRTIYPQYAVAVNYGAAVANNRIIVFKLAGGNNTFGTPSSQLDGPSFRCIIVRKQRINNIQLAGAVDCTTVIRNALGINRGIIADKLSVCNR